MWRARVRASSFVRTEAGTNRLVRTWAGTNRPVLTDPKAPASVLRRGLGGEDEAPLGVDVCEEAACHEAAQLFRGPSCERVSEAVPPLVSVSAKAVPASHTSPELMYQHDLHDILTTSRQDRNS